MTIQVFLRYLWLYFSCPPSHYSHRRPFHAPVGNLSSWWTGPLFALQPLMFSLSSAKMWWGPQSKSDWKKTAQIPSIELTTEVPCLAKSWVHSKAENECLANNIQLLLCGFWGTLFIITQLTLACLPRSINVIQKGLNKNRIKNLFTRANCITQTCGLCIISWLSRMN